MNMPKHMKSKAYSIINRRKKRVRSKFKRLFKRYKVIKVEKVEEVKEDKE